MDTKQGITQPVVVGCERPDGTLNFHSPSEVCEMCSHRVEAVMATVTREQLQSIEWTGPLKPGRGVGYPDYINGPPPVQTCPVCSRERGTSHANWCWLAAALTSPQAKED